MLEKAEKLRGAMAFVALADHEAGGGVERCDQRGRAMAHMIMRTPFKDAGQHRLFAIERLNLALLVDAEHQRAIGRR